MFDRWRGHHAEGHEDVEPPMKPMSDSLPRDRLDQAQGASGRCGVGGPPWPSVSSDPDSVALRVLRVNPLRTTQHAPTKPATLGINK